MKEEGRRKDEISAEDGRSCRMKKKERNVKFLPKMETLLRNAAEEEDDRRRFRYLDAFDDEEYPEEEEELWADSTATGKGTTHHESDLSLILTDPKLLDCPVCLDALSSPVYQCENGHIERATCCTSMNNRRAYCFCTSGVNCCRAIDKGRAALRSSVSSSA